MRIFFILIYFFTLLTSYSQQGGKETSAANSFTWYPFTGSANIHSVLNSFSKPLQYNPALNTITFFHQASVTYSSYPSTTLTAKGAVVAMISTNFGQTWDSACVWSDNNLLAKNPQGAVYNPPGNTNPVNAYLVGCGPVLNSIGNYSGNWYASKQMVSASFNSTISAAPGAVQFMPNTLPYGALSKHDKSWSSFTSTNDGKVRSVSILAANANATTNIGFGLRGALIETGNFNAGNFNWTADSIIPPTTLRSDGTKQLYSTPLMAWNQSGTVGYLVFIGSRSGASLSNQGWQPIIYKTNNSGGSWALTTGIDFNTNTIANNYIKGHIAGVTTNTALKLPYFNTNEGIGLTVDNHDNLHIATTIASTKSNHMDSLEYAKDFLIQGELYKWSHIPGETPYLYDFIGDGNIMGCALIDSLSSEAPGSISSAPGYSYNPWDPDPSNNNNKVTSGSRIQLSRTEDGKFILFTWAESDTNFTLNSAKWNELPNVRVRTLSIIPNYGISNEIGVSNAGVPSPSNIFVRNRAMFHYAAPVTQTAAIQINTLSIMLPITVSNSLPYSQLTASTHWFAGARLNFDTFFPWPNPILSIKDNGAKEVLNNTHVFPNPAQDILYISTNEKNEFEAAIIYNNLGQKIKEEKIIFENNIALMKTYDLPNGLYILNLKTHEQISFSKHFIIAR
ncbi:MAG: T9SS type A sorting domain-containing protein [Bacteroidetes bacterium]|nr:T9SS type A sorting domain-containing protein [Bacteroidota bacterium]